MRDSTVIVFTFLDISFVFKICHGSFSDATKCHFTGILQSVIYIMLNESKVKNVIRTYTLFNHTGS